jgi:two-component system, OmpR family, sensor histidine kinase KdpD
VNRFLSFLLTFVAQFAGGPGGSENNLVRFGLAAVLWAVLCVVAWSRQRQRELPRERLLVWGFGLGLTREFLMLIYVSVQMLDLIERRAAHALSAPLERVLSMAAVVVVAGAFVRYILDDDRLARRYLRGGLVAIAVCYLSTAGWWAVYATAHPGVSFGQTWCAWIFRLCASVLLLAAIGMLAEGRGWLRNVVFVALLFFFLDEFLTACSMALDEVYNDRFCPVSHAFHLLGIALLGYVYIREQSAEQKRAEEELVALNAIATTTSRALDLEHMLDAILDKVREVIPAEAGWIRLMEANGGPLSLAAQGGSAGDVLSSAAVAQLEQRAADQVVASRQPVVQSRIQLAERGGEGAPPMQRRLAAISVPIAARDNVVGALSVIVPTLRDSGAHKVVLLTAIGHQVGVAVENAWLAKEAAQAEIWKELNRLRSELIANVSHEIRTPLGLIKLSATSLLAADVEWDRETRRAFLQGIDQETDRLQQIVDSLLDLSQIESGRLRLDRQPTDLAQLAKEVVRSIEVQSSAHHIAHNFIEPLAANVDGKRMEQVLRNLLSNAIKYAPEGGLILLQGYEDKGQVFVQVTDEGIGIAPEDVDRVFERFYRVKNDATQSEGGVGLGLAVCQRIVEAHGGHMWVESELGQGSTFHVALPVGQERAAQSVPWDAALAFGAGG